MESVDYAIRAELVGHEEDVRAIAISDLGIITGSRDKTAKVWAGKAGSFVAETTLVGHTGFVSTVAAIPAGSLQQFPGEGVATGSRDLSVIIWDREKGEPAARLTGPKYQVSCIAIGKHSEVISTSHDGLIRIYSGPDLETVSELTGHQGPVQAVLVLPNGDFLTGGNDATIKLWHKGSCQHTFQGHTDTVRGLALLADFGVVSASHDMTLKVWDFEGNVVSELVGHTAIIYNAATSPSGLIASASEDNTARVWRPDGACLATILHPGCVWDVGFLPDNDLVTGCSDYVARVWSTDSSRKAAAEVQEAYKAALVPKQTEAASASSGLPEGLKLEEASALLQPGKEGQIKVIRENGGGMAYSWSASQGQWEKVGQVVGGPQSGGDMEVGSSSIDGVQFDYVISVEIDDRAQPLKLGVNRGDNPYEVADRFIENYDLPVGYREQIVQYIIQNTGGGVRAPAEPSFNPDPFTGGNAYVPGNLQAPPPGHNCSSAVTGGGVDPFTGSSSIRGAQTPAGSSHLPAKTMLVFDNLLNASNVGNKIRSLSPSLASASDTASMALTDQEVAPGGTLEKLLSSACAAPSGKASPSRVELELLAKLLRWPPQMLFPALDITRLIVFHEPTAAELASTAGPLEMSPLGCLGSALAAACVEPQLPANQQMGLRLLCNAFRSPALQEWLRQHASALLDGFSPALSAPQKAVRSSGGAFLLDLAILSHSHPLGADLQAQALSAAVNLLSATPPEDEDSLYRGIVAVGTLASPDGCSEARQIAKDLGCDPILRSLQESASAKVAAAAREAAAALKR